MIDRRNPDTKEVLLDRLNKAQRGELVGVPNRVRKALGYRVDHAEDVEE